MAYRPVAQEIRLLNHHLCAVLCLWMLACEGLPLGLAVLRLRWFCVRIGMVFTHAIV